jgi:hypothetical protein
LAKVASEKVVSEKTAYKRSLKKLKEAKEAKEAKKAKKKETQYNGAFQD